MRQQYMYTVQPIRPGFLVQSNEEEDAIVAEHFEYLERLCERGDVLLAGRTLSVEEGSFGLVILLADSEKEATRLMQRDPAVRAGIFRGRVFPFRIALAHPSIVRQPAAGDV